MSGNSTAIAVDSGSDLVLFPLLRYAIGSAITIMFAVGTDYTLAYLTPVLALNFLAPGSKAPTLRSTLTFLITIGAASLTGIIFSRFFLAYPLVFLPLLSLIIFHLYYTTKLQKIKTWLIISLLVIPMVSMQMAKLGGVVAFNLFINAVMAMLMVWVVYLIFPDKESGIICRIPPKASELTSWQRFISASHKSLVVIPVLILFFVFNLSDAILVLVFIAVLSMNPATASKKAGFAIILANLGGGLAAILVFNILTIATNFYYFGLLTVLTGLIFGSILFSMKPAAQLAGMAFSTFLLILGNVTSMAGEAGEKVWLRVFQIGVAVVYMVSAFALIDRLTASSKKNQGHVE